MLACRLPPFKSVSIVSISSSLCAYSLAAYTTTPPQNNVLSPPPPPPPPPHTQQVRQDADVCPRGRWGSTTTTLSNTCDFCAPLLALNTFPLSHTGKTAPTRVACVRYSLASQCPLNASTQFRAPLSSAGCTKPAVAAAASYSSRLLTICPSLPPPRS